MDLSLRWCSPKDSNLVWITTRVSPGLLCAHLAGTCCHRSFTAQGNALSTTLKAAKGQLSRTHSDSGPNAPSPDDLAMPTTRRLSQSSSTAMAGVLATG